MSYNVSSFSVMANDCFRIPQQTLEDFTVDGHHYGPDDLGLCEISRFRGHDDGEYFVVEDISYCFSGSGDSWGEFLGLLERTRGYLTALVVWEGGDTIDVLTVTDGEMHSEKIEQAVNWGLYMNERAFIASKRRLDSVIWERGKDR